MDRIVIVNQNPEFKLSIDQLMSDFHVLTIIDRNDLNFNTLKSFNPKWVFFLHWSHIVDASIYENFKCVVFHMTDLPYGRGGSPLQNLIVRGMKETKISAIKMEKELDSGDIYLKEYLSLEGSAREIFGRAALVIVKMMKEIIKTDPNPIPQSGEVVYFKRRNPSQSNIDGLSSLEEVYDHIRMLDADGYPPAFLETDAYRVEFYSANFNKEEITANVRIIKK